MSKVWEHADLAGGDLLVLLAISDFCNDSGTAWPSIETLAKKSRLSVRQVHYVIQRLESRKYLEIGRNEGPNGVNTYHVIISGGATIAGEGVQSLQGGGAVDCRGGGCSPLHPEPSLNRQYTLKSVGVDSNHLLWKR